MISSSFVILSLVLPFVRPFYTIHQTNNDHYTALLQYLEVKVRVQDEVSINRHRSKSLRLFGAENKAIIAPDSSPINSGDKLSFRSSKGVVLEPASNTIEDYLDATTIDNDDENDNDDSNDETNDENEKPTLTRSKSSTGSSYRTRSATTKLVAKQHKLRSSSAPNTSLPFAVSPKLLSKIQNHFYEGTIMLELQYDYLEPNALNAIQLLPFIKREKGKLHITKWWSAAIKWGLLTGELLQYHQNQLQSHPRKSTSSPPPYELIDKLNHDHRARVISIGDVHGCIDELLTLIRKVEILPGDLILFLGDMVAKGPFSELVIELAMDVNAVSVRGNHDYEIIRQYLKEHSTFPLSYPTAVTAAAAAAADAEAAVLSGGGGGGGGGGSKNGPHAKIARGLDPEEMEWLASQPYMIQSQDLGAIFVHAGFLPSKSLKSQSTKTMMTVRSLVDGAAVRRCVLNAPWAAEWKGPLTVYYGHDATRGFQRYPYAVCTDSGCVNGGQLTAVLFPEENIVSVPAKKVYLKQKRMVQFK